MGSASHEIPGGKNLVFRVIQMIQLAPSRFPGESRDLLLPWAPAFAGEAGLNEGLHGRVNRVNESDH
jgi:hypothetical protein